LDKGGGLTVEGRPITVWGGGKQGAWLGSIETTRGGEGKRGKNDLSWDPAEKVKKIRRTRGKDNGGKKEGRS